MLSQGPKTAQTRNPSQPIPVSLFRIALDSVFNGVGVALRNLMDGIKTEVVRHNSLQVLVDWAAYFKPELAQVDLIAIPSVITEQIKNAKSKVVEALKNHQFLSNAELQLRVIPAIVKEQLNSETPPISFSVMLEQLDPNVSQLIQMIIARSTELNGALVPPSIQLMSVLFATPEANAMLNALNVEEIVVAIQRDKQALQGLDRLCQAFNNMQKSIMNDPVTINLIMARLRLWSEFSRTVVEPMKMDLTKTAKMYGEFFMQQWNKTNLSVMNRLQPISDMQSKLLNDFILSPLYRAILQERRLCVALDNHLSFLKDMATYEAIKASSPEIAACLTKIELEVAAGALKPEEVVEQKGPVAIARSAPSAIVAGFRRRAASEVVSSSEEEEKSLSTGKRKRKGGK